MIRYICPNVTREGQFNGTTIIEFSYALSCQRDKRFSRESNAFEISMLKLVSVKNSPVFELAKHALPYMHWGRGFEEDLVFMPREKKFIFCR